MMVDAIRSVQRALSIVRLLAEVRRPLGVAEVAQAASLPPATAHRLLVTLVEEGWVDQDPQSAQYELGTGILGTAAIAIAYSPFIQAAKVTLTEVADACGLNTFLAVLAGHRVAYLASVRGRDGHDSKFRVGVVDQAHATCDGQVLLAALQSSELRRLYGNRTSLRQFTAKTPGTLDALEARLQEVRDRGYALDLGSRIEGWNYAAVPVRGQSGKVIAAIVAGGPENVATAEKMEWLPHEMRMAAEQLSSRIGFSEE